MRLTLSRFHGNLILNIFSKTHFYHHLLEHFSLSQTEMSVFKMILKLNYENCQFSQRESLQDFGKTMGFYLDIFILDLAKIIMPLYQISSYAISGALITLGIQYDSYCMSILKLNLRRARVMESILSIWGLLGF